jgi:hypothetical protein
LQLQINLPLEQVTIEPKVWPLPVRRDE